MPGENYREEPMLAIARLALLRMVIAGSSNIGLGRLQVELMVSSGAATVLVKVGPSRIK
jgi:hypothetical protein